MVSVRICSPERLDLGPRWDDLVRRAAPNVFMTPAALHAAQATGYSHIRVLVAISDADPARLVGLWALELRRRPLWPAVLQALPYYYAFASSPVLDPEFAEVVMPAFVAAIAHDPALPDVVHLQSFNAETPAFGALLQALAAHGGSRLELSQESRAVVTREFGVKRSGSTRKKLRQDWNRLATLGDVEVRNDAALAAVTEAFEGFLALERASWKGERGTAILCSERDAAFARRLIANLAAQGCASVAQLLVGGRVIAAQVLLYSGRSAYTWKIAFDAEFARFSPGALLVDKATEQLFAGDAIDAIDSCSAETSFMSSLWAGRRTMAEFLIEVGPRRSLAFRLEGARLQAIQRLRGLRDRLKAARRPASPAKVAAAAQPPA